MTRSLLIRKRADIFRKNVKQSALTAITLKQRNVSLNLSFTPNNKKPFNCCWLKNFDWNCSVGSLNKRCKSSTWLRYSFIQLNQMQSKCMVMLITMESSTRIIISDWKNVSLCFSTCSLTNWVIPTRFPDIVRLQKKTSYQISCLLKIKLKISSQLWTCKLTQSTGTIRYVRSQANVYCISSTNLYSHRNKTVIFTSTMTLATSKRRTLIIFLFLLMKKESKQNTSTLFCHFVRLFTFQEVMMNYMKSCEQHVLLYTCHVLCLPITCPRGQGAVQFSLPGSVRYTCWVEMNFCWARHVGTTLKKSWQDKKQFY